MSALERLFRRLGINTTRIKWKVRQMKQRREQRARAEENRAQHRAYPHKHCPACQSLVDGDARRCPKCEAPLPSKHLLRLHRSVSALLPSESPTTKIILVVLAGLYLLMTIDGVQHFGADNLLSILFMPPVDIMWRWGAHIRGDFEPWRLIMSNFIHFGAIHLLFNGYALRIAGPEVERFYGSALAWVLFVVTGILSMATSNLLGGAGIVAGASGALMGFLGLAVAAGHRAGTSYGLAIRNGMLRWAGFVMLFGLAASYGTSMGIDNIAHGAGFVFGVALGAVVPLRRLGGWKVAWMLPAITAATLVSLATVALGAYGMMHNRLGERAFDTCVAELKARNFTAAIDPCERAVAGNPDFIGAYHNLAHAYLNASRGEDAEKICATAVRRFSAEKVFAVSELCQRLHQGASP